jgi:hypothetical protein
MGTKIKKKNIWEISIKGLSWKQKNLYKLKKNEIIN